MIVFVLHHLQAVDGQLLFSHLRFEIDLTLCQRELMVFEASNCPFTSFYHLNQCTTESQREPQKKVHYVKCCGLRMFLIFAFSVRAAPVSHFNVIR